MTTNLVDSVPAETLHRAIAALGVSHVLIVPDTHQKTLLASLMQDESLKLHTLSTEDEAVCVNAGLWMGGAEPIVIIQNVGLFAAMNAVRGVAQDMKVPTCMIVGQYGIDVTKAPAENPVSSVRLVRSLMESMSIPYYTVDREADVGVIAEAFARSREERGPVVVLISAPTS